MGQILIEMDNKTCAALASVFCLDGGIFHGKDRPCQRKADADALRAGMLPFIETFKEMGQILPRKSRAAVLDGKFCKNSIVQSGYTDLPAGRRMLHAVL